MPMLEENTGTHLEIAGSQQKQRRQMLIALALLLVALIVVLWKDWPFLFPSVPVAEDAVDETTPETTAQTQPQTAGGQPAPLARSKSAPRAEAAAATSAAQTTLAPVVTDRAVLPPLEVEVVAGDQHRTVQPGNTSIKVDLQSKSPVATPQAVASARAPVGAEGGVATAAERVRLSPGTVEVVSHPVEPSYPLLARQMKVQGSVLLQALIGKDGIIQDLRVLSGPAILSAAAREAVKQWRFKPFLQAGLPVETEARITVNFTISTQ
jgi:TonB family protein